MVIKYFILSCSEWYIIFQKKKVEQSLSKLSKNFFVVELAESYYSIYTCSSQVTPAP